MGSISESFLCSRKTAWPTIINALFWAAAILIVAKIEAPGGGNSLTFTGLLIAGWFTVHMLIRRAKPGNQDRC